MKIPYTFVLLSSCVMISSAMAMIEPGDGEAATTSTTTLPLVHAPAAPAQVTETATNTGLHTAPPAYDPTATEDDDANAASRRATVEDADDDSSLTGSDEGSSNSDDEAAAPTASTSSTSSTSGTTSTTATPSLTFTKVANQTLADGSYEIKEFKNHDGISHQRLKKGPSQLFNLETERQIFGEYWQALKKTVGDFVAHNKADKASFFIRPMTSLQECLKNIEGDVNHLLTCGNRIFDDRAKLQNVNEVLSGLSAYLVEADYHLWMSKSSKPSVVYPWMRAYPTIGIRSEDSDRGDSNIFKHLDKMTEADRALHAQLPFIMYFSNMAIVWSETAKALANVTEKRHPIAGDNKWDIPKPTRSGEARLLELLARHSGMATGGFPAAVRLGSTDISLGDFGGDIGSLMAMFGRSTNTTSGDNDDSSSDNE